MIIGIGSFSVSIRAALRVGGVIVCIAIITLVILFLKFLFAPVRKQFWVTLSGKFLQPDPFVLRCDAQRQSPSRKCHRKNYSAGQSSKEKVAKNSYPDVRYAHDNMLAQKN